VSALLQVFGFSLADGGRFAVHLPELRLAAGEAAALYGPSGCGKSSMLLAVFGLLDRSGWCGSGSVLFRDRSLAQLSRSDLLELRRSEIAFLMQDAQAALDPLVRVGDQVADCTGASKERVHDALARLGVEDPAGLCQRQPHRISGGQAQRVQLAIACLRRPKLLIVDEPTASLDGGSYRELLACLSELVAAGSALLMATHDHRLLGDLNAEVYRLEGDTFVRGQPDLTPWRERPKAEVDQAVVLEGSGLTVSFGRRKVLDGVDLKLHRREVVTLLGESGAGKTTLLRVLAGHRKPDAGVVRRPARRSAIQLVGQDALASMTPRRSLQSLLDEASVPQFEAAGGAERVQLPERLLQCTASEMSGGEQRRAALLRAIAVAPDALLLDEPTASLDRSAAAAVVDNLLALQASSEVALMVATHDEGLAAAISHRQWVIRGGQLCEV